MTMKRVIIGVLSPAVLYGVYLAIGFYSGAKHAEAEIKSSDCVFEFSNWAEKNLILSPPANASRVQAVDLARLRLECKLGPLREGRDFTATPAVKEMASKEDVINEAKDELMRKKKWF